MALIVRTAGIRRQRLAGYASILRSRVYNHSGHKHGGIFACLDDNHKSANWDQRIPVKEITYAR